MFKQKGRGGSASIIAEHRRRRRNKHARMFAVRTLWGALTFVGVVAMVLFLPQLSVHTVTVTGAQDVPAGDVELLAKSALAGRVWGIIPRSQFFLVSTKAIRDGIAQAFPRAKTVYVARRFPHTLAIAIEEYDIWGVLCKAQACSYISRDGAVLNSAPSIEGGTLMHITDKREGAIAVDLPVFDEKTMRVLRVFADDMPRVLGVSAQAFALGGEYDNRVEATTQEGWRIVVDADTDPARALENLKLVLAKEIPTRDRLDYIDLRLPSKIFYRLRD